MDFQKQNNITCLGLSLKIYLPELDGLRFLAFLLVFVHHQTFLAKVPYLSAIHKNGWVGVDLFFALSAYLFTKLLLIEYNKTNTINFKKFYIRRIFRIWPIYFLFIGFSVAVYLFKGNNIPRDILIRIVGFFTFSDNIMSATNGYNPLPYVAHLWTITYEEQFYLFIPFSILLLVRLSLKRKIVMLIIIVLVLNLLRIVLISYKAPHPAIWVLPFTHFESIIMGIVIGFVKIEDVLPIKPVLLGAIGILIISFLSILPSIEDSTYWAVITYFCIGLSTSLILIAVANSDILKKILSIGIFVYLGKRSYGLYVYHLLCISVATTIVNHIKIFNKNELVLFILSLLCTIAAAIVSYRIIETPFLKLKKRYEIISSRPV